MSTKNIEGAGAKSPRVVTLGDGTAVEFEDGSGNVFADLGLADAEALKFKSDLIVRVMRVIQDRGLTQTAAAKITGMNQSRLSKLMRGQFDSITIDMLFKMLHSLGHDVEVRVGATNRAAPRLRLAGGVTRGLSAPKRGRPAKAA